MSSTVTVAHGLIPRSSHCSKRPGIVRSVRSAIKRLVASGVLHREQVAPWEIKRADLDAEVIRQALIHLQTTGKPPLVGNDSDTQQLLFT
jgi:hypothetical protein